VGVAPGIVDTYREVEMQTEIVSRSSGARWRLALSGLLSVA
jgi:hypothetical protein